MFGRRKKRRTSAWRPITITPTFPGEYVVSIRYEGMKWYEADEHAVLTYDIVAHAWNTYGDKELILTGWAPLPR